MKVEVSFSNIREKTTRINFKEKEKKKNDERMRKMK